MPAAVRVDMGSSVALLRRGVLNFGMDRGRKLDSEAALPVRNRDLPA